jgi:hypothetical protein
VALEESNLWKFHTIVYDDYLKPAKKLCLDLAKGRSDERTLTESLRSIRRSRDISGLAKEYFWFGKAYVALHPSTKKLNPYRDNLHRQWVETAYSFHATLREAGDPPDFNRACEIATRFVKEFENLDVQVLKAEVELACKLLSQDKTGASARSDLISYDEIALLVGVDKKTVQNCASEWRKVNAEITDPCNYPTVWPFLIKQWPKMSAIFDEDFGAVLQILERKRAEKRPNQ